MDERVEDKRSPQIRAAMDAYKDKGINSFDVEDWLVDGKPLKIFHRPLTVKDKALYNKSIINDSIVEAQVVLMIRACLDGQGKHLFNLGDKLNLMNNVEHEVVAEIFLELTKKFETQEDLAAK